MPPRSLADPSDEPSVDEHSELLTEHFGFHPRVFIDALVFAANELLYDIAVQFENFAKDALKERIKKGRQVDEMEVEKGMHSILTLMENALDHTFDVLELYCVKNVFGIRPSEARHMTLAHHRGLDLRTIEERMKDGVKEAKRAEDESANLHAEESRLQKRVIKAKRVRHELRLANTSAERSLTRAQEMAKVFSFLFVSDEGTAQLPSELPQSARKLSADASSLLKALRALVGTDALGSSLLTGQDDETTAKDRKVAMDDSGASEPQKRLWEKGREGYVNWEINRIMQSIQEHKRSEDGDLSLTSTSDGLKRRRKTESTTIEDGKSDRANSSDMQRLLKRLQQG
ncbi:hypothetical protein CBS101457_006481 [Exobasidium rhododendri]|nr:hypothetical protein CBS101457_006481 [Exobasidium rhododendri]